jgi:integrase
VPQEAGERSGQGANLAYNTGDELARTQRRFVDLDRGVIAWPPAECKSREAHVVPLEGGALALVRELMEAPPLWCPYLFHGRHCAPGRMPSKEYGCVGDLKKSWATACRKAGFPVGRKAGGVPVRVLWTVSGPNHAAACIFARTSRGVQWS